MARSPCKRSKTDVPTAAGPAPPLPPMLALLYRDCDARYALCEMLGLLEMVPLRSTCHTWRHWIDSLPLGPADAPEVFLRSSLVAHAPQWVGRWIRHLTLLTRVRRFEIGGGVTTWSASPAKLSAAFPLLRILDLSLLGGQTDVVPLLGCLDALGDQLQTFSLSIEGDVSIASLDALLLQLGRMRRLRQLSLSLSASSEPASAASWAIFADLPQLQSLCLGGACFSKKHPAGVRALAQCRSLTHLSAGVKWTDDTLRTLADSRPADAAPIQSLNLCHTDITAASWTQLKRFSGLTALHPNSLKLNDVQWAELPRAFPQLRGLYIPPTHWKDAPELDCALWLPALVQCAQLTALSVGYHIPPALFAATAVRGTAAAEHPQARILCAGEYGTIDVCPCPHLSQSRSLPSASVLCPAARAQGRLAATAAAAAHAV